MKTSTNFLTIAGDYCYEFDVDSNGDEPPVLITENETNSVKLYDIENYTPYTKDAFHRYIISGKHIHLKIPKM